MMSEDRTSYPLCWPQGWARTKQRRQSNFLRAVSDSRGRYHSMEEARTNLANELQRLGASNSILSTNVRLRVDGNPYSGQAQPADPGAAVYFKLKGRDISLACDRWHRVEDNIWAITKHIESLRGQDRWGVGSIDQAFRGYMAIPERTSGGRWQDVLGVAINATEQQIRDAYRSKVKAVHANGNDHEDMVKLNLAMEEAERTLGSLANGGQAQ